MGPRVDSEAHSQTRGQSTAHHPTFHHTFSQAPNPVVEKLVRLKNSDPELFSEAWNRLPGSVRDNILSYLKKYPNLLEKEYPLLLLHRTGELSKDEIEDLEGQTSATFEHRRAQTPEPVPKLKAPLHKKERSQKVRSRVFEHEESERPRYDWTDRELLARSSLRTENRESTEAPESMKGKADALLLVELRKISRQNKTQTELMRRLVQTLKDKS
jgi:hypothetical protein